MKKNRKTPLILLVLPGIFFCLELIVFLPTANAKEIGTNTVMQVAPTIEELSLSPATRIDKTITVANRGDKDLKIRVYVTPYSLSEEKGSSDFESQTEYTQLYHWIKIQDSNLVLQDVVEYTIEPQETTDIDYRIEVPESAPSGSQHACIFIETIPENNTEINGIVTASRTAVKIFANVSGKTIKDAEIVQLNADSFITDGTVIATTTVKNIGNVDIKPTLTLKINSLGGETVFSETGITMIFPEDSAEIKVEWSDAPAFGIYNMIASTNILGKNLTIKKRIFLIPIWFIVLLPIVIIVIIIILFRTKKRLNRTSMAMGKR